MLKRNEDYYTDSGLDVLAGIRHGFFTRKGGVSDGIFASLNCGPGSSDVPADVVENRKRVANVLGVVPENLCTLYQVHSDAVLTVDAPWPTDNRPQADAMVTKIPGLALGILTADCAPVLFADPNAKVIGACHAGWKGAFANIMERTVEKMEALGAARQNITAAIGPCIHAESYEVDAGFRIRFLELSTDYERFFVPSPVREGHHHFDLPGFVQAQLLGIGVGQANLLAKDTCFLENAFFSFRRKTLRAERDYGRQISVIVLEA